MEINEIFKELEAIKKTVGIFNPWFEYDFENDIDKSSYQIRQNNLKKYLNERINAKYLLVGEALGYQGGHFSGIAMTSERILLGYMKNKGIYPNHIFNSETYKRTSKPEIKKKGFSEPTATIVWQHMINLNIDTKSFIIWNAFPWHPYKPEKGLLSNRTPTNSEMSKGINVLKKIIYLFNFERIISIGEKSFNLLNELNIKSNKVRHPANGGATLFKEQTTKILN
jgi:hypothetical protein